MRYDLTERQNYTEYDNQSTFIDVIMVMNIACMVIMVMHNLRFVIERRTMSVVMGVLMVMMHMMMVTMLMRMTVFMVVAVFFTFNMGLSFIAAASYAHDTFLLNKIQLKVLSILF